MSNFLDDIKFDPVKSQRAILNNIEGNASYDLSFIDPTNPFVMQLEAITVLSTSALEEMVNNNNRIYPSLSRTAEDLYHHMTDGEEKNMFASPAVSKIRMLVNYKDILNNGAEYVNGGKIVTIPKNSEILVNDLVLTLEYDIDIVVKNNTSYVEQKIEEGDIIATGIGNLNSAISVDAENVSWVIFDIFIKQMKLTHTKDSVIRGNKFVKRVPIEDYYYYSEVYRVINGKLDRLNLVHSDIALDHDKPSVRINVLDGYIEYSIPSIYILNGDITGDIHIFTFSTKGKILSKLNKIPVENFIINISPNTYTDAAAAITNVNIRAYSKDIIDGGVDMRRLKDIRTKVIHNTTGENTLPITEKQLSEAVKLYGFTLSKELDTITNRLYIASKNISHENTNEYIQANIDVFSNRLSITLAEAIENNNIITRDNSLYIPSGTLFKESNGVVKLVSNSELTELDAMDVRRKIEKINNEELFFTPFHYAIDINSTALDARAYDLDRPMIDNMVILSKNPDKVLSMNVGQYSIEKTATGYKIRMQVLGNDEMETLLHTNIRGQLVLPIYGTDKKIYVTGTCDVNKIIEFNLYNDFTVDNENRLRISGYNELGEIETGLVEISNKPELYLYTINNYSTDAYTIDRHILPSEPDPVVICSETFDLVLGNILKNLHTNVISEYTSRKFKTETETVYLTYEKDVYELDPETGCPITVLKDGNGNCVDVEMNILHHKGELVLDNGSPVVLRNIGDIKLDENNNPIIDQEYGIIRFIDILMFEYEFKAFNVDKYNEYIEDTVLMVRNWLLNDLAILNNIVLENTVIKYRPTKSTQSLQLSNNRKINYRVSPTVIIYTDENIFDTTYEISKIKSIIGKIIHKYFDKKVIDLVDVKEEIINTLPNGVAGVKIGDIDGMNKEIYKLTDSSDRFVLNKITKPTLDIIYDIDLKIESI